MNAEHSLFSIPDRLISATVDREGEAGRRWLTALPSLVEDLCDGWALAVDGAASHGAVALVLPVIAPTGRAVLKVSFPHPGNRGEAMALRTFAGVGAVRLLAATADGVGLLLERAGHQTLGSLISVEEQLEVAGGLARRLAVPAPVEAMSLASTCEGWLEQLEQQLAATPGALSWEAVDRARSTITELADDHTPTMLHGDLHVGNVLRAEREPWLAIDPKGWSGTAAHDTFTVIAAGSTGLRGEPNVEEALRLRIDRFAAAAGIDPELALACSQARAVSSYLYQLQRDGEWFDRRLLLITTELH